MHGRAERHLDRLQVELAGPAALAEDDPHDVGNRALDGLERFFSWAAEDDSGTGRKRQNRSLTASSSRTNGWKR
jgi:hypothetical protein